MNKLALGTLALGLSIAAPSAFAQQCPPGSWLCADITIGGAPGPVEPPVVIAPAPPPPRVILIPPRPRIWVSPPPPARVYVAPPPVVVYQQPPPVYMQPQQPQWVGPPPQYMVPERPHGYVGLQVTAGGSYLSNGNAMWGVGAGLRLRGAHHLGAEIGIGYFTGQDYNGDGRTEVPVTFNGMFYFNPQNRLQIYGLIGFGASFADVQYGTTRTVNGASVSSASYSYLGATAGLGAELQLSPRFSLFADVRGFVRGRVDSDRDTNYEFTRTTSAGTEHTNTSAGMLGQLGAVLYF